MLEPTTTDTGATAPAPSALTPWVERWSRALPELVGINPNTVIATKLLDFAAMEMMREKDGPLWRAEREAEGLRMEIRRYAAQVDDMDRDAHEAYLKHTETEEAFALAQLALTGLKVEFHQHDFIPGFAAFRPGATTPAPDSRAFCVLNLGSLLAGVHLGDVPATDIPYAVAECMMHEVLHALEQWAEVEFSENRIEALLEKYRVHASRDDVEPDPPPRPMTSFLDSLTPEQKAKALAYRGPENIGEAEFRLDGPLYTQGPAISTHAGAGEERQRRTREALEELALIDAKELDEPAAMQKDVEHDRKRTPYPVCRRPDLWRLENARQDLGGYGPATTRAVVAMYEMARIEMAKAGPLPLASSDQWVEPLRDYGTRLQRSLPLIDLCRLSEERLESFGESEGLPRARLVLVEV